MATSSYENFLNMTVQSLQDYLTVRGISVSGYKKAELVARAFSAAEMKLPIVMSCEEQAEVLKKDYDEKLKYFHLPDPKQISSNQRIDDLTSWPPITLGNIFQYILSNREFNTEYIGKYKDQKAYSYFDSGFVGEILTSKTANCIFLFCNVRASMAINEEKDLWVAVQPDGKILTAWCSCMAGASGCCNHVIAAMYKVEYACIQGFCSPACTSIPCGWNKSTKTVIEPKRIADIVVRKKLRSTKAERSNREEARMAALNEFDPREKVQQKMTDERLSMLLNGLRDSNPRAVLFKSIEGMAVDFKKCCNLTVTSIANEVACIDQGKEEKVTLFLKKLCFTEEECTAVERSTRDQSRSKEWIEHRKGRLTASKHHDYYTKVKTIIKSRTVVKPKTTPLVAHLLYQDKKLDNSAAIKWGRTKEEDALKAFYAFEATKHAEFKVEKAGLFLDKHRAYIGASPDSIMYCKCHGKSVVEIKCPYNIKDRKIADGVKQCDFLAMEENTIVLKKSHKYYTQINSQIALSHSTCGYFVVWTTEDILIQQIEFDEMHWLSVSTNLEIFFKSYVAERVLGINPVTYCGSCEKVLLEENEIAENELDLRSICCDKCNCWYHLKCQALDDVVDGEWLCLLCLTNIADD